MIRTVSKWFDLVKDHKIKHTLVESLDVKMKDRVAKSLSEAIAIGIDREGSKKGQEYWEKKIQQADDGSITIIKQTNTTMDYIDYSFDGDKFIALDSQGNMIKNFAGPDANDSFEVKEFLTHNAAETFMNTENQTNYSIFKKVN